MDLLQEYVQIGQTHLAGVSDLEVPDVLEAADQISSIAGDVEAIAKDIPCATIYKVVQAATSELVEITDGTGSAEAREALAGLEYASNHADNLPGLHKDLMERISETRLAA